MTAASHHNGNGKPAGRPGIPADVTVITAADPMGADTVADAVSAALSEARAAGLPQPDYVTYNAGLCPAAGLYFSTGTPAGLWEKLRAWARRHNTAITAAEAPGHPGTYHAEVSFTRLGIAFTAAATITTPDPQ